MATVTIPVVVRGVWRIGAFRLVSPVVRWLPAWARFAAFRWAVRGLRVSVGGAVMRWDVEVDHDAPARLHPAR